MVGNGINALRTRVLLAPRGCLVTSTAGLLGLPCNGILGVEASAANTVAGIGAAVAQCEEVVANVTTRHARPGPVGVREGVDGTQRALRRARDGCIGSGWASDGQGFTTTHQHFGHNTHNIFLSLKTVGPINKRALLERTVSVQCCLRDKRILRCTPLYRHSIQLQIHCHTAPWDTDYTHPALWQSTCQRRTYTTPPGWKCSNQEDKHNQQRRARYSRGWWLQGHPSDLPRTVLCSSRAPKVGHCRTDPQDRDYTLTNPHR
jgi:hypothetical protein